jgi:ribosome-associated protein
LKAKSPKREGGRTPKPSLTPEALAAQVLSIINAHKGIEPVVLGVKGLCGFADYFLICSGASRRHVTALAEHLEDEMARMGVKPLGAEGLKDGHWILLDYNDLVVHIFLQPMREFYDLEGLWAEAKQVSPKDLTAEAAQPETFA